MALQESEKRYQKLISKMRCGFALSEILCDQKGRPSDCRFLEVNPTFQKITTLNVNEVVGKTASDIFPGTESFWIDQCGKVALSGKPVQFKNGSKLFNRYFEVIAYSPQRGQVATIFTEITRRVKIEEALRESETNFRAIAENANDGILILNEQATYVYANRRAAQITGYNIDELLTMSYRDLVYPDEVERVGAIVSKRIAGKSGPPIYETQIVTKQGSILPVEVSGSKTLWKGQMAALVILRDITHRKQVEQAMLNTERELKHRVDEQAFDLIYTSKELNQKQEELLAHKRKLENANKELVRTNTALSVLAKNIDRKKSEVEKKVGRVISSRVIPILKEIKNDKIPEKTRVKLDVLDAYLSDLISQTSKNHEIIVSLSPSELRVAMMIKKGFNSTEIGRLLHVSTNTVKTHRKNIRKKLNIQNTNINLASYLRLKLGKSSADI